jgi:hypothetical protein
MRSKCPAQLILIDFIIMIIRILREAEVMELIMEQEVKLLPNLKHFSTLQHVGVEVNL